MQEKNKFHFERVIRMKKIMFGNSLMLFGIALLILAGVPPILPATNIEVGPSAPPMTDTDFATDICSFTLKTITFLAIYFACRPKRKQTAGE